MFFQNYQGVWGCGSQPGDLGVEPPSHTMLELYPRQNGFGHA